ncbi:MAG: cadherin-like domain-containing protein, partial [Methylococcales bacterium]
MFNQNPTGSATAVLAATAPNTNYTIYEANLLQGFYDPDGDSLIIASLLAENGEVTDLGNGQWQFVPVTNFYGTVALNYLVSDKKGGDTQGTLSFNITAPQTAPTGNVTIDGTASQNQTITANTNSIADVNGLGAFSYQWL